MTTTLKEAFKKAKKAGNKLSELSGERLNTETHPAYGTTLPMSDKKKDLAELNHKISKAEQKYRLALVELKRELDVEIKMMNR